MNKQLNSEKIIVRLEQLGLTQSQLAQKIGVSRESVSKWFKNEKFPRPEKLLRLGLELSLSLHELTIPMASSNDPIVAFRKKARRRITDDYIQQAQRMGSLLEELAPYLPFNRFECPPTLKNLNMEYNYIQNVAAEVRRELGIGQTVMMRFQDFINKFHDLQAVIIPVLWGNREHHENALHVYLPASMSTWVYLNVDSNIHDFKFWMAHELGHVYIRMLQGEEAEDFADIFAQTLLFPQECAKQAYSQLMQIKNSGKRINLIKTIAQTHQISPLTVYCAVNSYAHTFQLHPLKLETIHAATTNFNKAYPAVIETIASKPNISPTEYIQLTRKTFNSPFFGILRTYLSQHDKSSGFIQAVLGISFLDAKAIYEELVNVSSANAA